VKYVVIAAMKFFMFVVVTSMAV